MAAAVMTRIINKEGDSMIRKIYLSCASLVLALTITAGGMLTPITSTQIVGGIVLTGSVATLTLTQVACSKDQLLASAQDILDVVTNASLIKALQVLSPGAVARLAGLVPVAKDLIAAIKSGDTSNALALINTIFPVIEEVAAIIVGANPQVAAILAIANIALHFIINHVKAGVPQVASMASSAAVSQALDYGSRTAWGCQYHPKDKRCTQ